MLEVPGEKGQTSQGPCPEKLISGLVSCREIAWLLRTTRKYLRSVKTVDFDVVWMIDLLSGRWRIFTQDNHATQDRSRCQWYHHMSMIPSHVNDTIIRLTYILGCAQWLFTKMSWTASSFWDTWIKKNMVVANAPKLCRYQCNKRAKTSSGGGAKGTEQES